MGQQITVRSRNERIAMFYFWKWIRKNGLCFLGRKRKHRRCKHNWVCSIYLIYQEYIWMLSSEILSYVRYKMSTLFSLWYTLNSVTMESILWMFHSTETHSRVSYHFPRSMPWKRRSKWGRKRNGFSVFFHFLNCLHIHIFLIWISLSFLYVLRIIYLLRFWPFVYKSYC